MRRCCDPDLMTVEEANAEERQNIDEEEDIELELELEKDFFKEIYCHCCQRGRLWWGC